MAKRPFGVTLIAILLMIEAVFEVLVGLGAFGLSGLGFFADPGTGLAAALMIVGIVALMVGIFELIVALGLWSLARWAWTFSVFVVWLDVILDFVGWLTKVQTTNAFLLSIIIPVILLVYLYQAGVKKAFGK